jgi:hypothetical protein
MNYVTFALSFSSNDARITLIVFMAVVVPAILMGIILTLVGKYLVVYMRAKRAGNQRISRSSRNNILFILGVVLAFFAIDILMGLLN